VINYAEAMVRAYMVATLSPDTSNQNGAVLLSADGQIVHADCNRFPRGFDPEPEHMVRPRKYGFIVHAEMAAVLGRTCWRHTLVCPWAACTICARCIVESGVKRLVTHGPRMLTTPERWKSEVEDGLYILRSGGVKVDQIDDKLNLGFSIQVNGEKWWV
jgi:deoxycytidylate deaminase